jgi:hypothetical protein
MNFGDAFFLAMRDDGLAQSCIAAKVSTAVSAREGKHVICVYTSNHKNMNEVQSCLTALRQIGIKGQLSYKSDEQTRLGINSSTYRSKDFESA